MGKKNKVVFVLNGKTKKQLKKDEELNFRAFMLANISKINTRIDELENVIFESAEGDEKTDELLNNFFGGK